MVTVCSLRWCAIPSIFVAVACSGEGEPTEPPPASGPQAVRIEVNMDSAAIPQLDSVKLTAEVVGADGRTIANAPIHFGTTAPEIIEVSDSGVIRSLGQVGSGIVELSYSRLYDSVHAAVFAVPAGVVLSPPKIVLNEGDSSRLRAEVVDRIGDPFDDSPVTFTTKDASLVTVDSDGVVSSVGSVGATRIVATSNSGLTESVEAVVGRHPSGVVVATLPASGAWAVDATRDGVVVVGGNKSYRMHLPNLEYVDSVWAGGMAVQLSQDGLTSYHASGNGIQTVDWTTSTVTAGPWFYNSVFTLCTAAQGSVLFAGINTPYSGYKPSNLFSVLLPGMTVRDSSRIGEPPNHCALHPSDSIVGVSAFWSNWVAFVTASDHRTIDGMWVPLRPSARLQGVAFSPDGQELYVVDEAERTLLFWGIEQKRLVDELTLDGGGFGVALSTDGQLLYIALPESGLVQVVEVASRSIVGAIPVGGTPRRIAFSLYGQYAIVTNDEGWVDIIN
jgi:YVTN family beta-propeller protein